MVVKSAPGKGRPSSVSVSVVVPTFNRANYIRDSLESIFLQTYQDFEVIVVDDGSTDSTKELLSSYSDRIKYIYQPNRGASAARNTGIMASRGRYIAFLDSDDLWLPEKLEKQVKVLEAKSEVGLVYSNIVICDASGRHLRTAFNARLFHSGFIPEKVLLWKVMCGSPPTWLVRKSCFNELGLLDTRLSMSEDRDISVRIALKYHIHGIAAPLTAVRLHDPHCRLSRSSPMERELNYFRFLDRLFMDYGDLPVVHKNKRKLLAGYYSYAGRNYLREDMLSQARQRFRLSITNNPLQAEGYFYLASTFLGKDLFRGIVNLRRLFL